MIGVALATTTGGRLGVAAGSLLTLAVAAPGFARLRRDPLDAPGLFALTCAGMFGAFSLGWLVDPAVPPPAVTRDDVSSALLIVAAGLAAASISALIVWRPQGRVPLRFSARAAPPPRLLLVLFAIGVAGFAAALLLGASGYRAAGGASSDVLPFAQALRQLASLGTLAIVACALAAFGADSRSHGRLLPILLISQVALGFVAGYKNESLFPVLLCGLALIACGRRLRWRTIAPVVGGTLLILVPGNLVYRNLLREPAAGGGPNSAGDVVNRTYEYATSRFRLIDHVALIHRRTPSVYPRPNPQRYTHLPALVLIPRVFWRDKPILNDGLEFSHTYWEVPLNIESATPLTQPGDLLRNFGISGVVSGLALWGAGLALLTRARNRWRSPRLEMIYLVAIVSVVIYVEADLPQLITGAARTLGVTVVIAWFLLPGRSGTAGWTRIQRLVESAKSA